jgi:membrane-bound lytic murein transglycosylase D
MKHKIRHILLVSGLMMASLPALAQIEDYDIDESDMPYGLQDEAQEDESNSYIDKNYLSPLDDDVELDDKNPFFPDEYFIERLKAIPGPDEFHVYNNVVRKYIDRYTTRMRSSVASMIGRYNLYANMFDDVLYRHDVPEALNYLPVIESAVNPRARSHAGASGLWQFMPSTGKMYGLDINSWVDERNDPYQSTEAAAKYLRNLYDTYGNWSLVLAAYNCGSGNVNRAIARAGGSHDYWTIYPYLPGETRGYVPAFIAALYVMNNYSQHNIKPRTAVKPVVLDTAVVHYDMTMDQVASACGISADEVKGFNPQYRTSFIPGGRRRCTIALPDELCVKFAAVEDSIYRSSATAAATADSIAAATVDAAATDYTEVQPQEPTYTKKSTVSQRKSSDKRSNRDRRSKRDRRSDSGQKSITIRQGDNLGAIAARNGTTVEKLRKLNNLKGDRIRAGNKLRVK